MRIVHESPELLIVAEPAVGVRISGSGFAALGAALLWVGFRTNSVASSIAGTVSLGIGLMLVLVPAITTLHFNRGEKRLVVSRRRLWNGRLSGRYDEYPLRDVVAAQVDESKSSDDGSTWRVVVRLTDGRVLPLSSYYTSGFESKRAFANRISGFLDLPEDTQSTGGASSPHAIVRQGRKAIIAIALMFGVFGAVFAGIGGRMVVTEYRRMSEWQPVQATVLRTLVETNFDSDGNTYRPVVVYRYAVDDHWYTSSRTLPVNESRSGRWAYRVTARFSVGGQYTAWYDPRHPSEAFIVRSHSVIAPVFTLIGLFAVIGGCAAGLSAYRGEQTL
jgi:hypothetical protein